MITLHARTTVLTTLAMLALTFSAHAQVWNEVGDAGRDGVGAAQITVGAGPLTTINGSLSLTTDVDLYCIRITDEALFRAEITAYAGQDPMLFLFNADGTLQVFNDDSSLNTTLSTITSQGVFANGIYYLGISNLINSPRTAANTPLTDFNLWPGMDLQQWRGNGGVLASWNDDIVFFPTNTGTYSITLRGAEFDAIPAPSAAALLGLGGFIASRRRRA